MYIDFMGHQFQLSQSSQGFTEARARAASVLAPASLYHVLTVYKSATGVQFKL
ncbi:hypothetical protein Z947_3369 [Sulfitobacter geojensis]|nr:hypothetical protein Z947_3369 [Sulfitobacter geojensis]